MASVKGNQKVAKKRSNSWRESLTEGRADALINPSILRVFRAKSKKSQTVAAKVLDMSTSTYGSIERGKRAVKEVIAKQIATFLNTDIKKVFKRSTNNKFVAIIK